MTAILKPCAHGTLSTTGTCPRCESDRKQRNRKRYRRQDRSRRARGKRNGSTYAYRQARAYVLKRDQGICWICGKPGADSADHIVPASQGGSDDPSNLRAAHLGCNVRRGAARGR